MQPAGTRPKGHSFDGFVQHAKLCRKVENALPTMIYGLAPHCMMTHVLCGANCSGKLMCKGHAHWVARSRAGKRYIVSSDGIILDRKRFCHATAFRTQLVTRRLRRFTDVLDLSLALYIALFESQHL